MTQENKEMYYRLKFRALNFARVADTQNYYKEFPRLLELQIESTQLAFKAISKNHEGSDAQFTKSKQLIDQIQSSVSLPQQIVEPILPVDSFEKIREQNKADVPKPITFQSSIVSLQDDINWIIDQLPQKPKTLALLFSSSVHGWKVKDWINACKGKPMTITLMKTTKGRVCGGYLHIAWKEAKGELGSDPSAFLFSLDHRRKLTPTDPNKAVYFALKSGWGPQFMLSLSVDNNQMMNAPYNCWCLTNGVGNDNYKVPTDSSGNSLLTGDGAGKADNLKTFTLAGIETWSVIY